jgi:hypothetical protein
MSGACSLACCEERQVRAILCGTLCELFSSGGKKKEKEKCGAESGGSPHRAWIFPGVWMELYKANLSALVIRSREPLSGTHLVVSFVLSPDRG